MNQNKLENSVDNGPVQLPDLPAPHKPKTKNFTFACAVLASMASSLIGYDGAVMSGAVIYIQNDLKFNEGQAIKFGEICSLSYLIGSAVAGITSDMVGRLYTIILGVASYFVGEVLMGTAMNYIFLMVGRVFTGIGVGLALTVSPVYVVEVSPALCRGFLGFISELFVSFGTILGSIFIWCISKLSLRLGWRLVLGIGAIPSVFMGLAILVIPESPRWVVLQGRLGEARRVLVKISDTKQEAQERLMSIQEAAGIPLDCSDEVVRVEKVEKGHEVWKELLIHPTPGVRRVLIAAVGIHFFQQASGMIVVTLYSIIVFKKAGIVTQNADLGVSVAVEFTKIIAIMIAASFIDKVGRRVLLLSSVAGMILSLILLATGMTVVRRNLYEKLTWAIALCMAGVFLCTAFFSMGLGPITSVYSSEIFPLKLRAQGHSIGVAVDRVVRGIFWMTFLSIIRAITIGGCFFLFAVVATVALVFFYACLPETKGGVVGSAGELPKRYMQAMVVGTAASGVLVSFLRIITKSMFSPDASGLRKNANLYFDVTIVFMAICIIFYNLVDHLPIIKCYKELKGQAIEDNRSEKESLTGSDWNHPRSPCDSINISRIYNRRCAL